jgi:hypothetical protein
MKANDVVQIRQHDGGCHWVYALVLDPKTRQVQIQHPGNMEHGQVKLMAAEDIRTKADVLAVGAAVQGAAAAGKPFTDAQLRQLTVADPWLAHFLKEEHSASRTRLHQSIAQHYQEQAKQLS